MAAVLCDLKCVKLPGLKSHAKFMNSVDVVEIEGEATYVRFGCQNSSLIALVCEANHLAPSPDMRRKSKFSLSRSIGLAKLIELRNEAQAQALQEPIGCSLFDPSPSKKKPRISRTRSQINDMRKMHRSIDVDVPSHTSTSGFKTVKMLRPISSRDNVFVEYDPDSLACVLQFIRGAGFTDIPERIALPAGIRLRRGKYVVVYFKKGGDKGYRLCDGLDDAKAFKAEQEERRAVEADEGCADESEAGSKENDGSADESDAGNKENACDVGLHSQGSADESEAGGTENVGSADEIEAEHKTNACGMGLHVEPCIKEADSLNAGSEGGA